MDAICNIFPLCPTMKSTQPHSNFSILCHKILRSKESLHKLTAHINGTSKYQLLLDFKESLHIVVTFFTSMHMTYRSGLKAHCSD